MTSEQRLHLKELEGDKFCLKELHLRVIPKNEMRYESCGDYWIDEQGVFQVRVVDTGNSDYHFLIFIHEITEQYLCLKRGIPEQKIMDFDKVYENWRPEGNTDEPGDDEKSPYKFEHSIATGVERMMAGILEIDWSTYDKTLNEL